MVKDMDLVSGDGMQGSNYGRIYSCIHLRYMNIHECSYMCIQRKIIWLS